MQDSAFVDDRMMLIWVIEFDTSAMARATSFCGIASVVIPIQNLSFNRQTRAIFNVTTRKLQVLKYWLPRW